VATIRSIASGSARLAATIAGAGDTLIFLHAGVADRRMWQPQLDAFAAGHRVVAYDRRGFGQTTCAPEPFSHLDDLRAVHLAITAEAVTLVGCSMGGGLAIDYALAHPAAVRALILVGSAVSGAPYVPPTDPVVAKLEAELDAAERAGDPERRNRLEARAWLDGPTSPEGRIGGELRELFLDMNGRALRAAPPGENRRPADAYPRLAAIAARTLVVIGTLDFPDMLELGRHLRDTIPGAAYSEMPGTAHLPGLEQPEAFNRLLAAFLGRR
jgi:pimeloyl-ACP methyl ester carboxylesterase